MQSKPRRKFILGLVCLSVIVTGVASAQVAAPTALGDVQAVVDLIGAAEGEILLVAPALTNREVAFALMQAAEQRGVRVLTVLGAARLMTGGSFGPYLALYTPSVRMSSDPAQPSLLIIDQVITVEGPLVASSATVFNQGATYALQDAAYAAERSVMFRSAWQASTPFELTEAMLGVPQ